MNIFTESYLNKKVIVTGHTGFKGSWLSQWLLSLGAEVYGISLPLSKESILFETLGNESKIKNYYFDIRDKTKVEQTIIAIEPDYIFHMAAQPLVIESYADPIGTYETNVMGTIHILNALQMLAKLNDNSGKKCAAVFVTTDKCYLNIEQNISYREDDKLGGFDPYSSSKAATELAISSFRNSFFKFDKNLNIGIASARAGNVIGGGDWAKDRIIPDVIRSIRANSKIEVRNPYSKRPWQHVLDPLGGYLLLGSEIHKHLQTNDIQTLRKICSSFNFGPSVQSNFPVIDLVNDICKNVGAFIKISDRKGQFHEAKLLNLCSDKAWHLLGWSPVWDYIESVKHTAYWYEHELDFSGAPKSITSEQISQFISDAGYII